MRSSIKFIYHHCVILLVLCVIHKIYTEDTEELHTSRFHNRKFNHRIHPRDVNNISDRCIKNSVTPVVCPEDLPDDRLLPHPDDCQLFYYCVSTDQPPICRDCPADLHFNPSKKVCDHPWSAGCKTLAIEYPLEINNIEIAYFAEVECNPINGQYVELIADPTNCTRFYSCNWGNPILMECPKGLHFNPRLMVCDNPESAWCQVNITIPSKK